MPLTLVTGLAGSGKSAVLREFVLSMPEAVDFALHARNLSANEVAARVAEALSLPFNYDDDALRAVTARERLALRTAECEGRLRHKPLIVVDSLDEAREQAPLVARFLRALALGSDVVVGLRTGHETLARLMMPSLIIDLDADEYFSEEDLRVFVERVLGSEGYPWASAEGAALVGGITLAAGRNFLVAGLLALARGQAHKRGEPWLEEDLPQSVSGAMRLFIDRLANQDTAWEMLLPPALAQGIGWPVRLWPQAVAALAGRPCGADEIGAFRSSAAEYLIEEGFLPDDTTVRTYHEALGETVIRERRTLHPLRHLRDTAGAGIYDHAQLAHVLEDHVRSVGWGRASEYARRYLAAHELVAGRLAEKLNDVEFLCAADPRGLHNALVRSGNLIKSPAGRCHEMAVHLLGSDRLANAYLLRLAALYEGYIALAERIAAAHPGGRYTVEWAAVPPSGPGERDGHGDWVTATAAFLTQAGWRVASASSDRTIRIWDPSAPPGSKALSVLVGHTDCVRDLVAFQADEGWRLASASDDGTVRIWDPLGEGELAPLRTLIGHTDWVRAVQAFLVDGRWYVASGSDDRTIRVWEVEGSDEPVRTLGGHSGWVLSLHLYSTAMGWRMASGSSDGMLMIWDPMSDEDGPLRTYAGHTASVRALAHYRDASGLHLISSGDDAAVLIWNAEIDAVSPQRALQGHTHSIRGLATFEIRGECHLATASSDQLVRIWSLSHVGDEPQEVLVGHNDWVRGICAFQTDNGWTFATGSDDGTLRLWTLSEQLTGKSERVMSRDLKWLRAVSVFESPDGARVATGGTDGHIQIWDPARLADEPLTVLDGHDTWVRGICVVGIPGDPLMVSVGDDQAVRVWKLSSPDRPLVQVLKDHRAPVRGVCSFQVGEQWYVASGGDDAAVRVWVVGNGRLHPAAVLTGHVDWIRTVHAFTSGSRIFLAAGGDDRTIRIWDLGEMEDSQPLMLKGHTDAVRGICTFGSGSHLRIASTSDDGTVRIWDPRHEADEAAQVVLAHKASGLGICSRQVRDGWQVATVSADHTVRVWHSAAPDEPMSIHTLTPNYAISPIGLDGFIVANQLGALRLKVDALSAAKNDSS